MQDIFYLHYLTFSLHLLGGFHQEKLACSANFLNHWWNIALYQMGLDFQKYLCVEI